MTDGEAKVWTKEEFLLAVTEICAVDGNRIEWINARSIECNSDALEQMWDTLMIMVSPTGLRELELPHFKGVTGREMMYNLERFSINSLTVMEFGYNADWWKDSEAFTQLLNFLARQTNLVLFDFRQNDLTTSQTTQLLQCIAQYNTQLEELYLTESANFDSEESVKALALCIDKCTSMEDLCIRDQVG